MTENNIIRFPQIDDDDLALQHRMAEVARLAERVADSMGADDSPMAIGALLDRLEGASEGLSEIGILILNGTDRLKTEQLCRNVQAMIRRIRTMLERAGVDLGESEDE